MKINKIKLYFSVILFFQIVAIVITSLPVFGMRFAAGEHGEIKIINFYSGFSDMLIGYGNWFPMLMLISLTASVALLIAIIVLKNSKKQQKLLKITIAIQLATVLFYVGAMVIIHKIELYYAIIMPITMIASLFAQFKTLYELTKTQVKTPPPATVTQ